MARGDGSIYRKKRKDGTEYGGWVLKYYTQTGRRVQEYTRLPKEKKATALKLLKVRLATVIQGKPLPYPRKVSIEDLYNALLLHTQAQGRSRKSVAAVKWHWAHLCPVFRDLLATELTTEHLNSYIAQRREADAKNATINRELATLRRCFTLAYESSPPRVLLVPHFPHLDESGNVRQNFVQDGQYTQLAFLCEKEGLWMRAMFEVDYRLGWRVGELLNLRVRHVDLSARFLSMDPDLTKNKKAHKAPISTEMYALLAQCVAGKQPDDYVFTRDKGRYNGKPVRDFRASWDRVRRGIGKPKLLFHDLRRTAVRNMDRQGTPQTVAMKITGHKTRSVYDRYNIGDERDLKLAAERMDAHFGSSSAPMAPKADVPEPPMVTEKVQ